MRLLVTGSRLWDNPIIIGTFLNEAYWRDGFLVVVHGDCPNGADYFAKAWAVINGVPQEAYPADWDKYGKSAGHIRNKEMVDTAPDHAVAFIKGFSRGTRNCIMHLEKAGIPYEGFEEFPDGTVKHFGTRTLRSVQSSGGSGMEND